ncbi:MAG: hypothetical protein IKF78_13170 [Atopobiaceae bacterium]|nr:hypothetical protein [Atopobiaceae bacterium]
MRKIFATILCIFVAVGLLACSGQTSQEKGEKDGKKESETIAAKKLDEYSWDELSRISAEISAAASDEAGREVAKRYGLVEEDGSLSGQTKMIVLDNKRALDVRLVGIRHDDKADGSGKAGLTFMTVGAVDIRPMNNEDTIEGGWEASSLRAWLANELPPRLDEDFAKALVAVNKLTNNKGLTDNLEDVTVTQDKLWVFSVHEVCGDVTWDIDEYFQKRGYEDVDGMLNAEGAQYEAFVKAGITGTSGPSEFLSLKDSTGTSPWWYRTPHPFDFQGFGDTGTHGYFYRVMDTGYPNSMGAPQDLSSVVVGFCV